MPRNATAMAATMSTLTRKAPSITVESQASGRKNGSRRGSSGPRPQTPGGTGIASVTTRSRLSRAPGRRTGPTTTSPSTNPATQPRMRRDRGSVGPAATSCTVHLRRTVASCRRGAAGRGWSRSLHCGACSPSAASPMTLTSGGTYAAWSSPRRRARSSTSPCSTGSCGPGPSATSTTSRRERSWTVVSTSRRGASGSRRSSTTAGTTSTSRLGRRSSGCRSWRSPTPSTAASPRSRCS